MKIQNDLTEEDYKEMREYADTFLGDILTPKQLDLYFSRIKAMTTGELKTISVEDLTHILMRDQ